MSVEGNNSGKRYEPDPCRPMDMVFGSMEEDPQVMNTPNYCNGPQSDDPGMESDVIDGTEPHNILGLEDQYQLLESCISWASSIAERAVRNETVKALEMSTENGSLCVCKHDDGDLKCREPCPILRTVMNHLRQAGYNAAICKSQLKYMQTEGFPSGGDYEYMDVILKSTNSGRSIRLLVDLDFRARFEIARPSAEYSALLGLVPKIYVGRGDRLQSIVQIMCEGVKNSLKKKGMHLPPWRKYKYMHSMWFGPYKRTTDPLPNSHEKTKIRENPEEYRTADESKQKQRSRVLRDSVFDCKMARWKSDFAVSSLPPSVASNPGVEKRRSKVSGLASALKEAHPSSFPRDFDRLSVF